MHDRTAIAQWGNSKAIRIPAPVLRRANLDLHDRVVFSITEDGILIRKDQSGKKGLDDFFGVISQDELLIIQEALRDTELVDIDEW